MERHRVFERHERNMVEHIISHCHRCAFHMHLQHFSAGEVKGKPARLLDCVHIERMAIVTLGLGQTFYAGNRLSQVELDVSCVSGEIEDSQLVKGAAA